MIDIFASINGARNLTLNGNSIFLEGAIGSQQPLNTLSINASGIFLGSNLISTIGDQTYNGNVSLSHSIQFLSSSGNFTSQRFLGEGQEVILKLCPLSLPSYR